MTKRVGSSVSSPDAARPRFSIDSILQGGACPVPAGLHWVPVTPQAMVQLQPSSHHKQPQAPQLLPALQQQQERANSQYLIQFLLNAGLPCPPYRSIMALSTQQQQQQQQQPLIISSAVPCSSRSQPHHAPKGCSSSRSSLNGPCSSPIAIPHPSLLQQPAHLQQQQQQQQGVAAVRLLTTTTSAAASAANSLPLPKQQLPETKLLLLGKEKKRKRLLPKLVTMEEEEEEEEEEEGDGSDATGIPRSRKESNTSTEASSNSEEDINREKVDGITTNTSAITPSSSSSSSSSSADFPCLLRQVPSPLLSSHSPSPDAAQTPSASSSTPPPRAPPPSTSQQQPSPPHQHHNNHRDLPFKKSRTSFSKAQIQTLEEKFSQQKYLTKQDRTQLASVIGLTEKHVKTWFQNRRTKWKKECSDADWSHHKEMAATLMYNQYLENKNKNAPTSPNDEEIIS